jgi:hypothetical protein
MIRLLSNFENVWKEVVIVVGTFRNLSKWGSQFFKAEEGTVENVPTALRESPFRPFLLNVLAHLG